jgi:hypothetical protein
VTSLVGESAAEVVVRGSAAGDAGVEHDHAIILGGPGVGGGESRVAEEARARAGDEADGVDVEVGSATLAELVLHRRLGGRVRADGGEPGGVGGASGGRQLPLDTRAGVVLVEDADLVCDLRITSEHRFSKTCTEPQFEGIQSSRNVAARRRGARVDDVPVHVDGDGCSGRRGGHRRADLVGSEVGLSSGHGGLGEVGAAGTADKSRVVTDGERVGRAEKAEGEGDGAGEHRGRLESRGRVLG